MRRKPQQLKKPYPATAKIPDIGLTLFNVDWHKAYQLARKNVIETIETPKRSAGFLLRPGFPTNSPQRGVKVWQIAMIPMLDRNTAELETAIAAAGHPVHILHRDYETRSQAILKTVGTYKYATNPTTTVLCCAYAVDDEPVQLWTPDDPVPTEIVLAAQNPNCLIAAHNDAFESAIEKQILSPQYKWPVVPIERHRCTQAMCLALGLPAKLSLATDVLELPSRKDAAGERLMHQT